MKPLCEGSPLSRIPPGRLVDCSAEQRRLEEHMSRTYAPRAVAAQQAAAQRAAELRASGIRLAAT